MSRAASCTRRCRPSGRSRYTCLSRAPQEGPRNSSPRDHGDGRWLPGREARLGRRFDLDRRARGITTVLIHWPVKATVVRPEAYEDASANTFVTFLLPAGMSQKRKRRMATSTHGYPCYLAARRSTALIHTYVRPGPTAPGRWIGPRRCCYCIPVCRRTDPNRRIRPQPQVAWVRRLPWRSRARLPRSRVHELQRIQSLKTGARR